MKKKSALQFIFVYLRRFFNYLCVQIQFRLGTVYVWGYPYVLIIDTTNICNLQCPLCPTGLNMPGRPKGKMDFDFFQRIIDKMGNYAITLVLHNWGEPILNRKIFPMIEYAKAQHIKVIMSSNLNILDEKDAEALITSGLDQLIVSIDAVSEESYKKYRKGGNFNQVIKNLKMLVRKREEFGTAKPKIIWQFLVFKHNVHEVDQVNTMAKKLKVDGVDILSAQLGGPNQTPYIGDKGTAELVSKWLLPEKKYIGEFDYFSTPKYLSKNKCQYLWKSLSINYDGSVSPCCCVYEPSTDFGNIKEEDFAQIWNNESFKSARSLFNKNKRNKLLGKKTICDACKVFKKPELNNGSCDENRN